MNAGKISSFIFEGTELPVTFVESQHIQEGVTCETYTIKGDSSKDLAVIQIEPGSKSPKQRVLSGTRTIQRFVSGSATLFVTNTEGKTRKISFKADKAGLRTWSGKLGE